jgi:maltose alpha-D-glucosyltransferase/alpha-amylase
VKKLASAFDPLWYKDAIIYELHVRAFADSNGDGIGDFPGLLSRLDYLQDLGVTCIWLLPFFPSPLRDDGYDISNYVDVNPSYGTLDDFKAFLEAAHQRGIQVMIELVVNHTSDQHPWFKAARLAPPDSPQRNMYVWSQTDQVYKDARIIFTDTEKSNWTWDETAKAYYWHRFFSHQPDLNFDNPLVLEEVLKAMRFWLDMGVDGLRMDAIPYLCERDGTSCENLPETHAIIKAIRAAIDAEYANRLILAEANQWPADVRPYLGDGDECHMAFHFPLMPRIYMALRQEDRLPITDIMAQTPPIPDSCQWGLFLRNHDELTLEMVTDDERDYMYFAYSADPRMRVNVGIRRRLAPLVDNNRRRIELLNSLLLSFPGTPILYYGDEIGMGDNIYLGDRNGVRTPMQWTSDRNAGFSRCDPARLYLPVIMDPIYGYQVVNVEAQLSDQSSLLHWTRNMIALRKLFQVFGRGTLTFLNPANRKVLAYLRDIERPDGSHETVLCVANLSRFAQPVALDLAGYAGMEPVEILGYVSFPPITDSLYALTLAPYSFLWLELQPARAKPEEVPEIQAEVVEDMAADEALALELLDKGWAGWFAGHGAAFLETALPAWLTRQRWFGAKAREIQAVRLMEWVEIQNAEALNAKEISGAETPAEGNIPPILLFIEVTYAQGPSDVYQLPLALSVDKDAEEIAANHPEQVIAALSSPAGSAILHDALIREDARQALLHLIERNATLSLSAPREAASHDGADDSLRNRENASGESAASDDAQLHLRGDAASSGKAVPTETASQSDATPHPLSTGATVAPLPIDAQPGEAAPPPRSSGPSLSSSAQRLQPRESPSAGDPAPQLGHLDAQASAAFASDISARSLPARLGSAEQSNTSILYGNKLILKLFRRLQPGENPDVEIGRFLTEVAHFVPVAPYMGEISITPALGVRTTIAMLQGLVANEGDGWSWFLEQLSVFFAKVSALPPPGQPPAPRYDEELGTPFEIGECAETTMKAAALLGRRTAEMHLGLSTPTEDLAFTAEPLTGDDLRLQTQRIEAQFNSVLEILKARFASYDETIADLIAQLFSQRGHLISRSRALAEVPGAGERIRIHGDYHLGQTLRTKGSSSDLGENSGDFVILDFEGEPARALAERRQKQSPLKDVAGMMRSFSYAAYTGLEQYSAADSKAASADHDSLKAWAVCWENAASAEFLKSYRRTIAGRPELLPPPPQSQALLEAHLLEKALYELQYELNNRPAWLRIPLAGILTL